MDKWRVRPVQAATSAVLLVRQRNQRLEWRRRVVTRVASLPVTARDEEVPRHWAALGKAEVTSRENYGVAEQRVASRQYGVVMRKNAAANATGIVPHSHGHRHSGMPYRRRKVRR